MWSNSTCVGMGWQLPDSRNFVRKSTRLLVSHEDMKKPSSVFAMHPKITTNMMLWGGSHPGVGSVSVFAGQYTREFVTAVLQTVPSFQGSVDLTKNEVLEVVEDQLSTHNCEVLAASKIELKKTGSELKTVIDKLHRNLGHPPNHDMVRILRHALASDEAIQLAKDHKCSFCGEPDQTSSSNSIPNTSSVTVQSTDWSGC